MRKFRPVFNPFYGAVKADELSFAQIKRLFVREASPIWEEVQQPVNQIIRGPRGAGKTILLKHLSYLGGQTEQGHIGIYIQISRIANAFRLLFPQPAQEQRASLELDYQHVFGDYLVLEITKELTKALRFFKSKGDQPGECSPSDLEGLLDGQAPAQSMQQAIDYCVHQQTQIERHFRDWELDRSCTWKNCYEPISALNRIAGAAAIAFKSEEHSTPEIYFLLDESAPIPVRCQEVVNSLLQRGRQFKTKLAVRPYEWQSLNTYTGIRLEAGTDFRRLELIYPEEMTAEYEDKARRILNRLLEIKISEPTTLRQGWPRLESLTIEDIFPTPGRIPRTYSGFRDICALSSSNPQNLLSICSFLFSLATEEGELAEHGTPQVNKLFQHQAMIAWSKDQEETIPDSGVLSFLRSVLRMLSRNSDNGVGISLKIRDDAPSLFPSDYLPEDAASVLKPAFALGLLRTQNGAPLPWDEVPSAFSISRSLLPGHEIPLRAAKSPELKLDMAFVRTHTKDQAGSRPASPINRSGRNLTAFLSTSFSEAKAAERIVISDALKAVGVDCQPLEGHQFVFSAIFKHISDRDFTILNASELRPYTLLELGLSAGLRKARPVICVFNDEGKIESFSRIPEFLKVLKIINFTLDPRGLVEMAAKVRREAEVLLETPNEFEKVSLTGVTLRPKTAKKSVYISHPDLPIWKSLIPKLRDTLETRGFSLVTDDTKLYSANCLQLPIFCTSLVRNVIIDTSGPQQPDLLQCYKLGVAIARKRAPLRVEQTGSHHPDTFSALPIKSSEWRDHANLLDLIISHLEDNKS